MQVKTVLPASMLCGKGGSVGGGRGKGGQGQIQEFLMRDPLDTSRAKE